MRQGAQRPLCFRPPVSQGPNPCLQLRAADTAPSARQFREKRYGPDRDYFLYPVGFWDKGVWHLFTFYVNDAVEPGLLVVEDVEHEPR